MSEPLHGANQDFPLVDVLYFDAAGAYLLIRELTDLVQWMSGSDDFSPGGKAHDYWSQRAHVVGRAWDFLKDVERRAAIARAKGEAK